MSDSTVFSSEDEWKESVGRSEKEDKSKGFPRRKTVSTSGCTPGNTSAPTLLNTPWRKFQKEKDPWNEEVYQSLKKEILTHELKKEYKIKHVNVLLLGQISAGKSSFLNTVESVFEDYVTTRANVGMVEQSLTTQYRAYQVTASDQDKSIAFKFCDTMGIEGGDIGLKVPDLHKILDGYIGDGADLLKKGGIHEGDKGYNPNPKIADKIHCVAFVVDAFQFDMLDQSIIDKLKEIRTEANSRSLHPFIILTRIDLICDETAKDVTKVYLSTEIQKKVKDVSRKFGITENMVYPVKNYSNETDTENEIDILTMRTLRQILRCSTQFLKDKVDKDQQEVKQAKKLLRRVEGGANGNSSSEDDNDEESSSGYKEGKNKKRSALPAPKTPKAAPTSTSRIKEAPSPPVKTVCTALYDYDAEDSDQLDMEEGDKFVLVEANLEGGWTRVKKGKEKGKVPTTFLEIGGKSAPAKIACKALYDYEAEDSDQLEMEEGDTLVLVEANLEGGWTRVKKGNVQGKVPTTFLEIGGEKVRPACQTPKAAPTSTSRKKEAPSPPVKTACTALYDYEAEDSDQLDMEEGDKFILVEANLEGEWTRLKKGNVQGKVPTTFLQIGD